MIDELAVERLKAACEATLLFHSGSPWSGEKIDQWDKIVQKVMASESVRSATTVALCDIQRAALLDARPGVKDFLSEVAHLLGCEPSTDAILAELKKCRAIIEQMKAAECS